MNFSAPCERGKWPRLLPPSSFSAHMSLNSSDWIELCNCFDFWPRAFIFPLFLSHFRRLHPTLPYIMTSRIYRLCGKNVINNSRCFIALQQLNLYGPAFEVLPLFADILARSHPHFGLVLLCVSFLLSTHKLMMLTMTLPKSPAPWLDGKSRKLKFVPANRNSAWPTEMETGWIFRKLTTAWIVQDVCVSLEVFQKSFNLMRK